MNLKVALSFLVIGMLKNVDIYIYTYTYIIKDTC